MPPPATSAWFQAIQPAYAFVNVMPQRKGILRWTLWKNEAM
jgi:hypothetical protein